MIKIYGKIVSLHVYYIICGLINLFESCFKAKWGANNKVKLRPYTRWVIYLILFPIIYKIEYISDLRVLKKKNSD